MGPNSTLTASDDRALTGAATGWLRITKQFSSNHRKNDETQRFRSLAANPAPMAQRMLRPVRGLWSEFVFPFGLVFAPANFFGSARERAGDHRTFTTGGPVSPRGLSWDRRKRRSQIRSPVVAPRSLFSSAHARTSYSTCTGSDGIVAIRM